MKGSASANCVTPGSETQHAQRLSTAALRSAVSVRVWGGKGCGAPCDYCRVLLAPSAVEYEVEALIESEPVTLHFHPRCHEAWKAERAVTCETADPN
jgi:hypothetical protein